MFVFILMIGINVIVLSQSFEVKEEELNCGISFTKYLEYKNKKCPVPKTDYWATDEELIGKNEVICLVVSRADIPLSIKKRIICH